MMLTIKLLIGNKYFVMFYKNIYDICLPALKQNPEKIKMQLLCSVINLRFDNFDIEF